jgi:hypothetical protein
VSFRVAQDVGHPGDEPEARRPLNVCAASLLAGFQVSIIGRFWVSTEAL